MTDFIIWLLESSLLVIFVLGIRKLFAGRIGHGAIYALWLIVLFRFMIPINLIPAPFGIADHMKQTLTAWEQQKASTATEVQQNILQGQTDNVVLKKGSKKVSGAQSTVKSVQVVEERSGADNASAEGNTTTKEKTPWYWKVAWKTVLLTVWIAGVILMAGCLILSNQRLTARLKRERKYLFQKNGLAVYSTNEFTTPCLYGLWHPAIYLPAYLVERGNPQCVSREKLHQIIEHETVHYLHKDYFWTVCRMGLLAVYWYDPFVWVATKCSEKDAELFCDETVIRRLGESRRFQYGELLIQLASGRNFADFRYSMMPISRKGREIEHRIFALSCPKKHKKWLAIPMVLLLTAGTILTCSTGVGYATNKAAGSMNKQAKNDTLFKESTDAKVAKFSDSLANLWNLSGVFSMSQEETLTGQQGTSDNVLLAVPNGANPVVVQVSADRNAPTEQDMSVCRELFYRYVTLFTEAVNTGKTDKLSEVLAVGSEAYEQQCAVVQNYSRRGIREKIHKLSIASEEYQNADMVQLDSNEQIKVAYGDGAVKIVKQRYGYTCEKRNGKWLITTMTDLEMP